MTPDKAKEWAAANGATIVPPSPRPYWIVFKPAPSAPDFVDFAVGELLAEAVLAFQKKNTRRCEHRRIAPQDLPRSGP